MNNVISTDKVCYGYYMIIKGTRRYVEKDKKYFLSCEIPITEKKYTLCNTVSYSILNKDRVMISGEMLYGKSKVIDTSLKEAKYIVVCSNVDLLTRVMVLDEEVDISNDIPYIPPKPGSSGVVSGGGTISIISANSFQYDTEQKVYEISSVDASSYDTLSEIFMVYVSNASIIRKGSSVSIFGKAFTIVNSDGSSLSQELDVSNSLVQLVFNKKLRNVKILYSKNSSEETGGGSKESVLVEIID